MMAKYLSYGFVTEITNQCLLVNIEKSKRYNAQQGTHNSSMVTVKQRKKDAERENKQTQLIHPST